MASVFTRIVKGEIPCYKVAEDDRYFAFLDINMGCPVPKIVKNGEGSALLKRLDLVYDLISAMVSNTSKPVTAKIRIGFDKSCINAVETAKAIEEAGAAAVAVHGRTREQYYSGKADWTQIRAVKNAVAADFSASPPFLSPSEREM